VTSTEDAPTSSIPDQTKEAGKIVNATSEGAAYLRFHDVGRGPRLHTPPRPDENHREGHRGIR